MSDAEEVRKAIATELRSVADDLESDELVLTSNIRYTRVAGQGSELPAEVEVSYYVNGVGERTVEVWI